MKLKLIHGPAVASPPVSPKGKKEKEAKSVLRARTSSREQRDFSRQHERKLERVVQMTKGGSLILIDQNLCKPHRRWFRLSEDGTELCWEKEWEMKLKKKAALKLLARKATKRSLATVVRIVYGPFRRWMRDKNPAIAKYTPWLCFTLEFAPELEDIQLPELIGVVCNNEKELDIWLAGLSEHSPVSRLTYFPLSRILWRRMKLKLIHGPVATPSPISPKGKKEKEKKKKPP